LLRHAEAQYKTPQDISAPKGGGRPLRKKRKEWSQKKKKKNPKKTKTPNNNHPLKRGPIGKLVEERTKIN